MAVEISWMDHAPDAAIRELIEGNYRIIYWLKNASQIDVLTVYHARWSLANNPLFRQD